MKTRIIIEIDTPNRKLTQKECDDLESALMAQLEDFEDAFGYGTATCAIEEGIEER